MPDNGTTPVTTDDELEDGQIIEERKEEEEQKIQQPEEGSRRPPSGSTFTIRSRMYNQMMAKAYHRLVTLYHFKIIRLGNNAQEEYEMEKWLVEGFLGHTGYRNSHIFPTPPIILDAPSYEIARKLCIEHVQAIASISEVNPDIKVIKWQSSRSRNPRREWIGTVMKLQSVHHPNPSNNQLQPRAERKFAVFKKPTLNEQRTLYTRFSNDQYQRYAVFNGQRHAYQVDWLRYCRDLSNLPNRHTDERRWHKATRIPSNPPFAHTIQATTRRAEHARDTTKYLWTGRTPWYEKLNCLQEIYDKNGEHIGRESSVRLHWSGLRALQTMQFDAVRRNRKRVTGIIYIQYPQDWALYKDDFRMTVTYWRADAVLAKIEEEDIAHLRRTLRGTILAYRAVNIKKEYLKYYEADGRKIGRGRYGR